MVKLETGKRYVTPIGAITSKLAYSLDRNVFQGKCDTMDLSWDESGISTHHPQYNLIEEFLPNEKPTPQSDPVNHPSHYNSHPSGIECITIARHHDFNIGNAIKYLWRAGLKELSPQKEIEDLKKAVWYINDKIEQLEKNNGSA